MQRASQLSLLTLSLTLFLPGLGRRIHNNNDGTGTAEESGNVRMREPSADDVHFWLFTRSQENLYV